MEDDGILLSTDGNHVRYKSYAGTVKKEYVDYLKANKSAIIKFLQSKESKMVELNSMQIAYMVGQTEGYLLNKVNAHYYIKFEKRCIDVERLEKAVNYLIECNDALRLILLKSGEGFVLDSAPYFKIEVYSGSEMEDELREEIKRRKYEVETWPMYSFCIEKKLLGSDILHFSFDCSILDAWSAGRLFGDLIKVYSGEKITMPNYSYRDYMNNLGRYLKCVSDQLERADDYWSERVRRLCRPPSLCFKTSIINLTSTTFLRKKLLIPNAIVGKLTSSAQQNSATLTAMLFALYLKSLADISETKEFSVIATVFGKMPVDPDSEKTLGEFTNIGLVNYDENKYTFMDNIRDIQKQLFKLIEFRAYDGTRILEKIQNYVGKRILFPVVVTCMLGEEYKTNMFGFKEIESLSQTPQVALDHHIRMIDGELVLTFDYVSELFEEKYIDKLIKSYQDNIFKVVGEKVWLKEG